MTEELARALAEELPRARRRMWTLLGAGLAAMVVLLVVGLVLMHAMASSQP